MSTEFLVRIIGMFIFAFVGARVGVSAAEALRLPELPISFIFGLVGVLFGLILTPILTVRPIRHLRHSIVEIPLEVLFTGFIGLFVGLMVALLLAYPFSQLPEPWGWLIPPLLCIVLAYLSTTIFLQRSREVWIFMSEWLNLGTKHVMSKGGSQKFLLDTSILIDGRIVDIAKTGFLNGTLIVPRFIISELHQVADSSDSQRRNRGRRGLSKLNELQREPTIHFQIIEDDVEDVEEVDDKLIALALRLASPILTIDFPMNQVAQAQGVEVLNINALANAVRSAYIPGESFPLRVLQEGKEFGQGVGYLEDGTMVIVENGREYMDRTIYVTVTKLINKESGRIIFATPEK